VEIIQRLSLVFSARRRSGEKGRLSIAAGYSPLGCRTAIVFQLEWISHQLTEAYGWKVAPRYIIRDRDAVYGDVFIRRLRAMSIRDRPTAPGSPWQNGYCERAIGSIRRECLDHVVVFGERHLRHLLRSYATYLPER
jgi:hypothetical protein